MVGLSHQAPLWTFSLPCGLQSVPVPPPLGCSLPGTPLPRAWAAPCAWNDFPQISTCLCPHPLEPVPKQCLLREAFHDVPIWNHPLGTPSALPGLSFLMHKTPCCVLRFLSCLLSAPPPKYKQGFLCSPVSPQHLKWGLEPQQALNKHLFNE